MADQHLLGSPARPANWDGRPYAGERGWTDDHRGFRDWLMNELLLAGCDVRTLSPMGMAQVTVEHMVRQGWYATQAAQLRAAGEAEPCPCFAPDIDPETVSDDTPDGICACGHALDEHEDDGTCDGMVVPGESVR